MLLKYKSFVLFCSNRSVCLLVIKLAFSMNYSIVSHNLKFSQTKKTSKLKALQESKSTEANTSRRNILYYIALLRRKR